MINIKFPDGNVRQYEDGVTPLDIAKSISEGFARNVLAASLNDEEWDISRPICMDGDIKFFKWEDAEGKHAFWHTSAHLLAEALQELYPSVQFGIGPAIENGFYYDIDTGGNPLTDADFAKIEKKMMELVQKNEDVVRADISKADALKFFGDKGQTLKCELINDLEDGHITTYTQGNFTDLCRVQQKNCEAKCKENYIQKKIDSGIGPPTSLSQSKKLLLTTNMSSWVVAAHGSYRCALLAEKLSHFVLRSYRCARKLPHFVLRSYRFAQKIFPCRRFFSCRWFFLADGFSLQMVFPCRRFSLQTVFLADGFPCRWFFLAAGNYQRSPHVTSSS